MSEHTPLTEAERDRVTWVLGDLLRYYAERRSMANPKGWDHILRQFDASEQHYRLTVNQAAEVRAVLVILAARTSTATTDDGLRERVEAELNAIWRESQAGHMIIKEAGIMQDIVLRLRELLDATAAPTTDTGARDE